MCRQAFWADGALRRFRLRFVTVLISTMLALMVANLAIFLFEPWLGEFVYDTELGFRVRPYHAGANRFGFNDADYPLTPVPGVYRVLVLGDSFGWVGGRDDNYTAILERMFDAHFGAHKVDVICAGYSMTHTVEQLAVLRKFGLAYAPDLVVLGFFAGNDFVDADPRRRRIAYAGSFVDVDARAPTRTMWGRPMLGDFRVAHFVRQNWMIAGDRWRSFLERGPTEEWLPSPDAWLTMASGQMRFYDRTLHDRGVFDAEVNHIRSGLEQMHALLDARRVGLRVAVLPAPFSVHPERAQTIWKRFGMDPAAYDLALAQRILRPFLEAEGIPYLDLLDPFRNLAAREELYVPFDDHWNAAGTETAARLLFEWLLPHVESAVNSRGPTPNDATVASRPPE